LSELRIAVWCHVVAYRKLVWTMVRPARSLRVLLLASIASYCSTHTIDNVTDERTLGEGKGDIKNSERRISVLHTAPSPLFKYQGKKPGHHCQ
jgi:hypothetical protein